MLGAINLVVLFYFTEYLGIAPGIAGGLIFVSRLWDIGAAVEDVAGSYGIVRHFVGHGIGTQMHEEPQVPNYRAGGRALRLEVGMCLAIEPMFTLGSEEVEIEEDGWTVSTVDRSAAAHFEHSIAITEAGPRVLTTV